MMKKLLFIFFILWTVILTNNIAFWNCNSCSISSWPAPVLSQYLTNLKKLSNNFSSEISKLTPNSGVKKDASKTKRNIQSSFNKMISWDWYYSLFDFYVLYGTSNSYVPEIWRDYNLLKKESDALWKYYDRIIKRWYDSWSIDIEKLCAWIENCNFSSQEVFSVLWEIIQNHEAVMDYYRLSILWKRHLFKKKIFFIWENFKDDLYGHYNEYTTENCASCEWGALERAKKQIDIIVNWQQSAKDGMKSWQDAIAMLDGTYDEREYERRERQLLEQELRSKWLSMNASNNVIKNLDKYNEWWWFTKNNNFITNSFDYIKNSVKSQIVSFRDSVLENFKGNKKTVPLNTINTVENNLYITSKIEEKIAEIYNIELPYASFQDNSVENLEARMMELHYDLTQAIENLDSTVKISRKVCNDQWQWLWVCE